SRALRGHGRPADGPVWPSNWAYALNLPRFQYQPQLVSQPASLRTFTCLFSDPLHEPIALELQRQLHEAGVNINLEQLPVDQALPRVQSGDFDAFLADAINGPSLLRPYWFWHSNGPFNWGHFSSAAVDAALDSIRHAPNDDAYKAGVAAFQRAIV